jgi:hypothetical protein
VQHRPDARGTARNGVPAGSAAHHAIALVGPLGGPAQIDRPDRCRQGEAVDPPGEQRRVPGQDRAQRLVDQREPGLPLAAREQRGPADLQRHGGEVGAALAVGDLGHRPGTPQDGIGVTALLREERLGKLEIGMLDRLGLPRQVPAGAGQPARRNRAMPGEMVLEEHHPG